MLAIPELSGGHLEFHNGIYYILLLRTLKSIHEEQEALYSCGVFQMKGKFVTCIMNVLVSLPVASFTDDLFL